MGEAMDPNETIRRIRVIVDRMDIEGSIDPSLQSMLVDLWRGLDGWLSKGNFLPSDWKRAIPSKE